MTWRALLIIASAGLVRPEDQDAVCVVEQEAPEAAQVVRTDQAPEPPPTGVGGQRQCQHVLRRELDATDAPVRHDDPAGRAGRVDACELLMAWLDCESELARQPLIDD